MHLVWLDWVFFIIVIVSSVIAFFRGFVCEAVSMLTWLLGFFLATRYSEWLSQYIGFIDNASAKAVIAFIAIFVCVLVLGFLVNILMKKVSQLSGLGFLDHSLGVVFGFLRGVIVVIAIIILCKMSYFSDAKVLGQSFIINQLDPIVEWSIHELPDHLSIDDYIE